REVIEAALAAHDRHAIFELGSKLSSIFRLDIKGDRSQGGVSAGGNVWELLVSYYLNLSYAGTNALILRNRSFIPDSVIDALTVSHQGIYKLSDLDSILICHPLLNETELDRGRDCVEQFKTLIDNNFNDLSLIV